MLFRSTSFKQGAMAIKNGTNALDVISELSDQLLKTYNRANTPKNKLGAQAQILELLQANGIQLPFTIEDLSSTSQTPE